MNIWVVETSNQLFIKGSYTETKFIDIYLPIDKACVIFLKLFTNFPYRKLGLDTQNMFFLKITVNSPYP